MGSIPSRREVLTTDASLAGWGAVWQCRAAQGSWAGQQREQHINVLELWAVLHALQHFLPVLAGRHVFIRTDNTAVVYHINHQGTTRSLPSLRLTQRLLSWAYPRLLSLSAIHLPGVRNTAADFLSWRRPHPSEWRLHPEVVQIIWHYYGRAGVDIFASQATTHCPLWFSLGESTRTHWPTSGHGSSSTPSHRSHLYYPPWTGSSGGITEYFW